MTDFNNYKMIIYINLLIILTTVSCQQKKNRELVKDDFSISYPSHLELDASGQEGVVFILKTKKKGEKDIFIENINLATKGLKNSNFDEFATKTEKEIGDVAKIVESKRLKLNDKDCLRLVFELFQNNVALTFIQHYFVENKKIYVLTFSSETKEFKNYMNEMNKVLLSFKIK